MNYFHHPYSNFSKLQDNKHVQWADIINLHWVSGFVDYQSFFSNLQKPIVWTLHDMNPYLGGYHYSIDSIKNNDLNGIESEYKLIKQNCVRVDAVIGNSNWNTNEAIKSLVFNHTRIFKTIYYSLPLDSYYPIDKELAKKSLGIENSTIVIGFACEKVWSPRKGFNILLEAINNLNAETKSKILCVAFGKKADNIEDLVPNVRIMQIGSADSSEKQRLLYSAMNVFVIPSLAEAFGLSALEALACGTPIIGSDTGGIPEMIDDGKNGYLFKCGDSIDLSNKIMTFILQEQNWVQMSQNAVNSVALKHLPSFQAREYLQVYNEVLSKNK